MESGLLNKRIQIWIQEEIKNGNGELKYSFVPFFSCWAHKQEAEVANILTKGHAEKEHSGVELDKRKSSIVLEIREELKSKLNLNNPIQVKYDGVLYNIKKQDTRYGRILLDCELVE
ncbi:head-tail adaptor protein [Listeria monocytogenes]|nr:hypothetical protein [Listeria monocytogenes]EAF5740443.1 hypothetical protein [Listeria monocytogenes]EFU5041798.1 head-tail adaptor protein [Listeria monocytogenes]EHK9344650.1 head-tail adaptor protein [Listeria monocytogenes]EHK9353387.1 head-tail adaptor protein [Listeria monocytogenes]